MTDISLRMQGIRKSFSGVEVLHGVDLNATGGEVVALLGENGAGKSTLVKILAGDYTADEGLIDIDDVAVESFTPLEARQRGIRMIFQEFQDAGPLSVAENIVMGRWPSRVGVVNWRKMRSEAGEILHQMGVDIDPRVPVGSLKVGERQVVEIARALADSARLLILDEPTAALSHQEVVRLFEWVRRLRDNGVCIIYITHRLDEVYELADRVVVLRNGDVVLEERTADVGRRALVEAMVGRDIGEVRRPDNVGATPAGDVVISLQDVSIGDVVSDVSLDVSAGEVVCLYGKLGSGTTQVAELCFGLRAADSGDVRIRETARAPKSPVDAIDIGVGYLPPDRKREAAFLNRPVAENLAVSSWSKIGTGGVLVTKSQEFGAYQRWQEPLGIKSASPRNQPIATLSGGNQQKVVLGRWLERESNPLVLVEPTRGVDVGARQEIYAAIRDLATQGKAILVVTSDYEEAVQVADRAIVMARGRIAAEFEGSDVTTQGLIDASG
jgi:ABC-type sugar transport system ATPase subunit